MIKSSEERKQEKQQQIQTLVFDTTTKLMKRYNFDEITIRMICAEANISIGMFYRNFSGKTDILSYFYQKALADYKEILDTQQNLNFKEKLLTYYIWVASYTASFGNDFIKHFYTPGNNTIKADSETNEIAALSNQILQEAIDKQEYILPKGRKCMDITHDFLVLIKGIILDWYVNDGAYDLLEYASGYLRRVADILLF